MPSLNTERECDYMHCRSYRCQADVLSRHQDVPVGVQHTAALHQHEASSKLMDEEQQALKTSQEQLRAELQRQSDSHRQTEQELSSQLRQVQGQLQEAASELTQLRERSQNLSAQLEETCAAKEAVQQNMEDSIARLDSEREQQLSETRQQLLLQVSELEQQLTVSQNSAAELQAEVTRVSSAVSAKELELIKARDQTTEALSQLADVRASLNQKAREMTVLDSLKQQLSDQLIEREKQLQAVKEDCDEKQMMLDKKEEELRIIGVNLENIKMEGEKLFSESIAKVDSLSEDKLELEAKLSELGAESGKLTAALQKKDSELQKLKTSTEDMRAARQGDEDKLSSLEAEVAGIRTELRAQEADACRLKSELACTREQLCAREADLKRLENDKKNVDEKLLCRNADVTRLEGELVSVQEKLRTSEIEVKRFEGEKMIIEKQLRGREDYVSRLEGEVTSAQAQLGSQASDVSRLEAEVSSLRTEIELKQGCINAAQQQVEQLQRQMQEVQLSSSTREEADKLAKDELMDKMRLLEAHHEQTRSELQSAVESGGTERNDLQQQVSSAVELQQQLQLKIEQLRQEHEEELEKNQQKLCELESAHKSLLNSLRHELSQCKTQTDKERLQLQSEAEERVTLLTSQLADKTREVSEKQTLLRSAMEELQQVKQELKKNVSVMTRLEAEMSDKEKDWSRERQGIIEEADKKQQALVVEAEDKRKAELERAEVAKQEELQLLKQEFDSSIAVKEAEAEERLQQCKQSLLTQHGLEVTQMIGEHLLEKEKLIVQVAEAEAEMHRLKSELSCKEELLVQRNSEGNRSSTQCAELHKQIESLKAQYADIVEKCELQARERDLISADLGDFKKTCGNLEEALKDDKESYMKALKEKDEQHKIKMEEISQKLKEEFNEIKTALESQLSEKSSLLKKLQNTHEQLFEKNQSQEETYTIRMTELMSDVSRLQQEKKDIERSHQETLATLNANMDKFRSDNRGVEKRLQEMTLAREMLKIELSQTKKKYDEIVTGLREEVKSLREKTDKLKKKVEDSTDKHTMTSGMLDEVRQLLKNKEQELGALQEAFAANEKTLGDEHSEEVCALEDQITHLNKVVDHMKEESERKEKTHEAQMIALNEDNSKVLADLQDSFKNKINEILKMMKSSSECRKLAELENDDSVLMLERMQALKEDLGEEFRAKIELRDRVQSLLEEVRCQKEAADKVLEDKNKEINKLQLQQKEKASCETAAIQQMEVTLKTKDHEITSLKENLLKKELEISKSEREYQQQIIQDQNEHKKQITELMAEQLLERENLTTLLNLKTAELDNSKGQLEKLVLDNSTKIFDLEAEIQTLKTSCVALENDKHSLERALSESSSSKADLGIKILELEEEAKTYKNRLQEKEQAIQKEREMRENLQELVDGLKQEVAAAQVQTAEAKAKVEELSLENSTLLALRKEKEKEVSDGGTELLQLQDQLLQLQTRLQRADAALVDKDKEITSAKEDVMRVEREAENSTRSLKEEITALKLKYKADKQAYAAKMKSVFKDQIEKLMAEAEKYKSMADDYTLVLQKYEAAKNKLMKTYADLNDATTAKDDYYEQTQQLKEHINKLRESVLQEKQLRQEAESGVEPLRAELTAAQQSLKAAAAEKRSLLAKLSTADSKLRQMDRNWRRESLGGPGCTVVPENASIRNAVSESTLATVAGRPAGSAGKSSLSKGTNRSVTTKENSSSTARRPVLTNERPNSSASRAAPANDRPGSSALTASYRKAVGRSSIRASGARTSSSTEEDTLDGSDVPLLAESRLDNKSKLTDGLFRKPSIRITAADNRCKLRAPVELRALTCKGDEDEEGGEGSDLPQAWEEGEKKLMEETRKKAVEGERKKRLVQRKDGRRMTVDGRILPDDEDDSTLTRSVPRGLGSVFNCEDEDQEFFSNKYFQDMEVGLCVPSSEHHTRLSELHRRNSLYPPQLRCSYAAEMQFNPLQEKFDSFQSAHAQKASKETGLEDLESATERLVLESPAFNLRKRKSLSDSLVSADSLEVSFGKKVRRLSTSYSRPGPPTPGRKSIGRVDKENRRMSLRSQQSNSPSGRSLSSYPSSSSLPFAPSSRRVSKSPSLSIVQPTPKSMGSASGESTGSLDLGEGTGGGRGGRGTPATRRSNLSSHTPASIKRLIRGKSPWKKLTDASETPKADSKLKIFRRPFGSKNYNVLSASQREREGADQSSSQNGTVASSSKAPTTANRSRRQNRTCV
ncbi:hypothetical protein FHG87_015329 [Trinorchestia longiramus]|nr:hypothetical protein FHG87_015329 [Trinorchestia longiramus]